MWAGGEKNLNDSSGRSGIFQGIHQMENKLMANDAPAIKNKTLKENTKPVNLESIRVVSGSNSSTLCNCSVCQIPCERCKSKCITCKLPCQKCGTEKFCKNSSTDTDDFDKFLEAQSKKYHKTQPKVKTMAVDTCDLESHFDYYKLERETVRIQKSVATDCADLNIVRSFSKKVCRSTVATDTSDLFIDFVKPGMVENDGHKFSLADKRMKTQWIKNNVNVDPLLKTTTQNHSREPLDSLFTSEDDDNNDSYDHISVMSSFNDNAVGKENVNNCKNFREVTFDTSSDESDIDLITACKLSKSKELAKKHKIILKEINVENCVSFECTICKKVFSKKYLATLHLGSHIENNKFKCLICTIQFNSIDVLFNHVQNKHSKNCEDFDCTIDSNVQNKNKCDDVMKKSKVQKVYQCALCLSEGNSTSQFDSYKALYLHKKYKHGVSKADDNKTEKRVRIKQEFICLICGKQFKSSKALKDHSPVHTGEKNYLCDICNKSYTTSANLKIHKRTHTGARNFICSVCNKAFHKKDSLKVHFRKHSGERPFQCDLCPMRFDRNYILKNHRYTHFSEKTFICPFCGKTFTTHGGLNNHEKSHKKDPFAKKPRKPAVKPTLETENAVICDVCGKIYSTKSNLRIHKFVHLGIKPFECNVCHQFYAKKDSMLTHMRKHFDDRPFSCETCGMKFYRNHTLKTHLLRHTGERPHKCKICGKSFTQSSSLAYHVKNHDKKGEKKKSESNKVKKKKIISHAAKSTISPTKKLANSMKSVEDINSGTAKQLIDGKKPEGGTPDLTLLKNAMPITLPEKIEKNGNFILPLHEKEILIIDKSLSSELARNINVAKGIDFLDVDKGEPYHGTSSANKFNYYITKNHLFSLPKEVIKEKPEKNNETIAGILETSKNSCLGKEEQFITLHKEPDLKNLAVKEEILELKSSTAVPISGEILNAAFINDENGDVIPFSSMTLHSLNADNVMISPVITLDGDERKGFIKSSKLTVLEPKIAYGMPGTRIIADKNLPKSGCHLLNLKDARISQKIHIEFDSTSLQIQSAVDDGAFQEIPCFYNTVQQNEL